MSRQIIRHQAFSDAQANRDHPQTLSNRLFRKPQPIPNQNQYSYSTDPRAYSGISNNPHRICLIHSCYNRLRQYFTILVIETSTLYSYLLFQEDIYNICIFLDPSDALLRSYAFSMSLPLRQNLLKSNSGNFEN